MNSCWTREPQLPTRASSHAKDEDVVAIVDVLDTALGESTICGEQSKPPFIGSVMAVLLTPTPPSTGLCGNGGVLSPTTRAAFEQQPNLPTYVPYDRSTLCHARYLTFGNVNIMPATNSYL